MDPAVATRYPGLVSRVRERVPRERDVICGREARLDHRAARGKRDGPSEAIASGEEPKDLSAGRAEVAVAGRVLGKRRRREGASLVGEPIRATDQPGALTTGPVGPSAYFVDKLFRSDRPVSETRDPSMKAEVGRIFANALRSNQIPAADQDYLSGLIAARTGISLPEAQKRISDVLTEARQTEDTARKVAARLLLWFFLALLMGAFGASYAATIGGRQRDHVPAI